mmetsp:Transcript_41626/g.67243  ORF Transcript_41626/g.67243 Transcript_41626/m.67243 type:complete len:749 (+) Transcript_41626:8446-10692(+)
METELRKPLEVLRICDLVDDESFDDVAAVHVNGDKCDDLVAHILAKRSLHSLDELVDPLVIHLLVFLHGCLAATLDLLKDSACLLSPDNLCRDQSELGTVSFEPRFSGIVHFPVVRRRPCKLQLDTHLDAEVLFESKQVALHCPVQHQILGPRHLLRVFGDVTAGNLACVWGLGEIQSLDAVKDVAQVFCNLQRPVSVGQNVKQSLVGHEVESWECLLLLLQVLVQSLLASVDAIADIFQCSLSALGAANLNNEGAVGGIHHEVFPGCVHHLESLGVIWQLRTDVVALHKDGFQAAPVRLHLCPNGQRSIDALQLPTPLVHERLAEFDESPLRRHAHHLQRIAVQLFEDLSELAQQRAVRVGAVKSHWHLRPTVLDGGELLLDLGFFHALIHDFGDLLCKRVEVKVQKILEAEVGALLEGLLCDNHEASPVPVAHGLSVKVIHQRQNCGHVLDLLDKPSVQCPAPHLLRHVLDLKLEVSHSRHQFFCVDLVPQDLIPALESILHHDHSIPQILEKHNLRLALSKLTIVGHLHVKQQLQIVELICLLPNEQCAIVVGVHGVIAKIIIASNGILAVKRTLLAELVREALELFREHVDPVPDLEHLLALQWQDLLLHIEGHADDLVPLGGRQLQLCEAIVNHVVFLEQLAQVSDGGKEPLQSIGGQLHIPDVRHGRVEELLVLWLIHRRRWAQTNFLMLHKVHQSFDAGLCEGLDVVHVLLLPGSREADQRELHRLSMDPEPVNVYRSLHV